MHVYIVYPSLQYNICIYNYIYLHFRTKPEDVLMILACWNAASNCSALQMMLCSANTVFDSPTPSTNQITVRSDEIAGCFIFVKIILSSKLIKVETLDEVSGYPTDLLQDEVPKSLNYSLKTAVSEPIPRLARPVAPWCVGIRSHLWGLSAVVGWAKEAQKGSKGYIW